MELAQSTPFSDTERQSALDELTRLSQELGLYDCHYTGEKIPKGKEIAVGAIIPNVKAKYYVSDIKLHRESKRLFDESEANCNTCKNLVRVKHEKCQHGFLYGKCAKNDSELTFHPDDPMHMDCYQQRD